MAPKTRSGRAAPPKPKAAAKLPPPAPSAPSAVIAVASVVAVSAAASVTFADPVRDDEAPKKKRRTLRDAEQELEASRHALHEAKKKLIITARENAKMKVLLMKYIDKDDSLLCTSQLSMVDTSQQEPTVQLRATNADFDSTQSTGVESGDSQSPRGTMLASTGFEESENSESSMWTTSEFQTDDGREEDDDEADGLMMGPVSQLSQMSQWSEFSSTSNLDEIITFLEKQDTVESERMVNLESEFKELRDQKTVVRVGVGVILTSKNHPECVLIGRRKGSHGAGKFALPGGHLEMFESWEECAIREVKEETDLDLSHVKFAYVTNDPMEDEDKHYITIFMQASVDDQVPRNMEPNKCEGWFWEPWQSLRTSDNMFMPLYHITRSTFTPSFE